MNNTAWRTLNARQESNSKLINEYIDSSFFWDRFNPINEIIIGTGGSGKTAMLRMMSISLLTEYKHEKARKIVADKEYIGVYIPLMLYLGEINELEHLDKKSRKNFFVKAFNIISCKSFLTTIMNYTNYYMNADKLLLDEKIHNTLKSLWMSTDYSGQTLRDLKNSLSIDWLSLQSDIRNAAFEDKAKRKYLFNEMSFFSPISTSIEMIFDLLSIPENTFFMILIDEAEFLSDYQRIEINSLLRSEKSPFIFKIATVPFVHNNLETKNKKLVLRENQDFQFVSIDEYFCKESYREFFKFTKRIINNRLQDDHYWNADKIVQILLNQDYSKDTIRIIKDFDSHRDLDEAFLKSLSEGRRASVIEQREINKGKRDNKITNKFLPVYCTKLVHEYYKSISHSKPSFYYGYKLIIKISEGNIRNFIKIMNSLSIIIDEKNENITKDSHKLNKYLAEQNSILFGFADKEYGITKNLCGKKAFQYFSTLCKSIQMKFYEKNYITPYATSFSLTETDMELYKEELLSLVKEGRIVPQKYDVVSMENSGTKWRISYLYAMKFWVHMRWGIPLYSKNFLKSDTDTDINQLQLWNNTNE